MDLPADCLTGRDQAETGGRIGYQYRPAVGKMENFASGGRFSPMSGAAAEGV